MKWLGIALAVVAVLVFAMGALAARTHRSTRTARFAKPPEEVFAAITGFAQLPQWRAEVSKIELLDPVAGKPRYREHSSFGVITYEVEDLEPPRRYVARIADEGLGYGGRWIFEVAPDAGGCRLTITEDGFVDNLFFRFMARFVFGYAGTLEKYLKALGRKFGEETRPEPA